MGVAYSHLSLWERQRLFVWYHYEKKSQREIGRLLGRSHTTISRELKRNISTNYVPTWYPHSAQSAYKARIRERGQRPRLKNHKTRSFVTDKLKIGWAPEIIAGRSKIEEEVNSVCHESIYQFIYKEANGLIEYLPRHHKKRRKKYPTRKQKTNIEEKTSILDRPEIINDREEFGHWESDSIVSPKQKPGCNVLVERSTHITKIAKLSAKTAQVTTNAIIKNLKEFPSQFVNSITYDNGSENTKHNQTNKALECDSYFCQPYHSWEKGAVEQINGLIRRYLPKKTDITTVPISTIKTIEEALNSRPRKCLSFKTPMEAYQNYLDETQVKTTP